MPVPLRSVSALILFSVIMRILPHPPNMTPMESLAIYSGFLWKENRSGAFLTPLVALILGDLVFGFHPYVFWVYGSLCLSVLMSYFTLKKSSLQKILLTHLVSSVCFYGLTNFGVWLSGGLYPLSGAGLSACYIAGLPFLLNSIVGSLFYGLIFFTYDRICHSPMRKSLNPFDIQMQLI